MNASLRKVWESVQSSYWFIPAVMTLAAIVVAFLLIAIDTAIGEEWLERFAWMHPNRPEGARALLSTIAGSMITVAGVVFSVTIVALSYATSQFGPRLLTNFMRDRGNQITLGTFIATFMYCLLVLRTIRSAEEEALNGADIAAQAFVPQLAVLGGLLMALASIGVLIFFLNHIPDSIHASNVIARIGRDLNAQIDKLFPARVGLGLPMEAVQQPEQDLPETFDEFSVAVLADSSGYIQHMSVKRLVRIAADHELILHVLRRPGEFISGEQRLVKAWPRGRVDDDIALKIRRCFAWGSQKTQAQDVLFLENELVEIASRALSTGTNDPFTAMSCMDWLGSALINLAGHNLASRYRYDDDGKLLVVLPELEFNDFAEAAFEPLRPYAQRDRNAALRMMRIIAEVAQHTRGRKQRQLLLRYASHLKQGCENHLQHDADLRAIDFRYRQVARMVNAPDGEHLLNRAEGSRITPSDKPER